MSATRVTYCGQHSRIPFQFSLLTVVCVSQRERAAESLQFAHSFWELPSWLSLQGSHKHSITFLPLLDQILSKGKKNPQRNLRLLTHANCVWMRKGKKRTEIAVAGCSEPCHKSVTFGSREAEGIWLKLGKRNEVDDTMESHDIIVTRFSKGVMKNITFPTLWMRQVLGDLSSYVHWFGSKPYWLLWIVNE